MFRNFVKSKIKTMEALTSFIIDNYPAIAFLIAGIFIGGIVNKYRSILTNTKKKVDEHTKKINAHTNKIDNLPCDSHRRAIVNIEKSLLGKKRFKANLTVAYSPRKLSELGYELYQKSGMQIVLEANMNLFIKKIEDATPTSALDVEDLAYSVLYSDTSELIFKPVKDWLFNNPVFNEMDIDMSAICYVASFELRDVYLKKHPEILPD